MAVTDLTGTKWLFNEVPSFGTGMSYSVNFISNSKSCSLLTFTYAPRVSLMEIVYTSQDETIIAYSNSGGWGNEAYRTIQITGGDDATNSDLIAWLQANATQIQEQSNNFSFGNLPIENVYFGTRQVKKIYIGNTLVWEKEATIISFSIRGNSYQAEEGMTWAEWCASEYNTEGFYVTSDNKISTPPGTGFVAGVTSSDIIVANYGYNTSGGGGA